MIWKSNRPSIYIVRIYGLRKKVPSWKVLIPPPPPSPLLFFLWGGLQSPWPPSWIQQWISGLYKKYTVAILNTEKFYIHVSNNATTIPRTDHTQQNYYEQKLWFYTKLHNNEKDPALIWMHTMKIDCFTNVRPNIPSQENELPWTGRSILFLVVVVIQSPYWCYQTEPQAGGF